MKRKSHQSGRAVTSPDTPAAKQLSRRSFIRAGATAMPVVLTLQSGEALARSSNLISAAPAGTRNAAGQALCLDTSTSTPMLDSTKYDIGDPGYATLNVVPDVDFYPLSGGRSDPPTSVDVFCTRGGSMKFHDGGWHQVDLPANGIIVSANALNSVSSRVDIWEQFWP